MIKVSVIVPVYNVEKYLKKCLDSLVNQTLEDIEIIVVNDGSPANEQVIIDEYVKNNPNKVKSFIKENGGLASARNFGVEKASGEYIGFVDSDDYVSLTMYEDLYKLAKGTDSEVVISDVECEWENGTKSNEIMQGVKEYKNYPLRKRLYISPLFACNKIFKRSFFQKENFKFVEGRWYEDIPCIVSVFAKAKKIEYLNKTHYIYLQRENSITSSKYNEKMYDIFYELEKVYEYYKKENLLEEYSDEIEYLFIEHFLVYGAFRFLRTNHYKELMKTAKNEIHKYFPNWRKNPYIHSFGLKNRIFLMTNCSLTYPIYKKYIERRDKNEKS